MPTLSGTVRRPDPVPRYLEVARHIESKRRELCKPLRMPAEPALASEYRVARDTLRRALVELEKTGAVTRQRGRGRGTYLRPLHLKPTNVKGKAIEVIFSAIDGQDVPAVIRQPVTLVQGDTVVPASGQRLGSDWARHHEGFPPPNKGGAV